MNFIYDAVVVGSGPNGLSAAVRLAEAGLKVAVFEKAAAWGGGARTAELTLPGFRHDLGSAVHPLAVASPYFRSLRLEEEGLKWIHSPAALAHPLEEENAVMVYPSVDKTAALLGRDGASYRRLFGKLANHWEPLFQEVLGPALRFPKHPLLLARFGAPALLSGRQLARLFFSGERPRALFGGIAAHANAPLERMGTGAVGMMLLLAAHAKGWPIPRGGAQAISDALVSRLRKLGGEIFLGRPVETLADLPKSSVYLLDQMPGAAARLLGDRLSEEERRGLLGFKQGPGVFKVDWALRHPIPWKDPRVSESATVHLGGSLSEISEAERAPGAGALAERPYVLLSQPTLFDPSRAPEGKHTAWAYCHVPAGSAADRTEAIESQVERFAPGFRASILAKATRNCAQLESENPNLVGGDIGGGELSLGSLLFRPRHALDPYRLPAPGFFLCSSATPPGPGVHGMAGFHAAESALAFLGKKNRGG